MKIQQKFLLEIYLSIKRIFLFSQIISILSFVISCTKTDEFNILFHSFSLFDGKILSKVTISLLYKTSFFKILIILLKLFTLIATSLIIVELFSKTRSFRLNSLVIKTTLVFSYKFAQIVLTIN